MHKKIAIFGGTFDPLHNGHIEIVKLASLKFALNKVIFIPAFISPHKTNKIVTSPALRYEMVHKSLIKLSSITPNVEFEISNYEILQKGKSYTIKTIKHFKENVLKSDEKLFLIIGEDSKNSFDTWKDYNNILDKVKVISVSRTEENGSSNPSDKKFTDNRFFELKISNVDISSTNIRNRIENELDISNLVPDEVYKIIKREKLYK